MKQFMWSIHYAPVYIYYLRPQSTPKASVFSLFLFHSENTETQSNFPRLHNLVGKRGRRKKKLSQILKGLRGALREHLRVSYMSKFVLCTSTFHIFWHVLEIKTKYQLLSPPVSLSLCADNKAEVEGCSLGDFIHHMMSTREQGLAMSWSKHDWKLHKLKSIYKLQLLPHSTMPRRVATTWQNSHTERFLGLIVLTQARTLHPLKLRDITEQLVDGNLGLQLIHKWFYIIQIFYSCA